MIDKRKIVQGKAWWHVWRELKPKDYDIHFKSFKLERLSSRRTHIFSKASMSCSSRTRADLTSSSCSSKACTTSSCSTWWVSIWDNDCSNWTSLVCRSTVLNLILSSLVFKDAFSCDASERRNWTSTSCRIKITGLGPLQDFQPYYKFHLLQLMEGCCLQKDSKACLEEHLLA